MKHDVFLGLGGNIGDTEGVLRSAIQSISSADGIEMIRVSRFYRTSPVGNPLLDPFINAACHVQTSLHPLDLLSTLQTIEISFGKLPKRKNDPRIIDIDILFYANQLIVSDALEIPHPRWKDRLFVLVPLLDLTPFIEHPLDGKIDLFEAISSFSSSEHQSVAPQVSNRVWVLEKNDQIAYNQSIKKEGYPCKRLK